MAKFYILENPGNKLSDAQIERYKKLYADAPVFSNSILVKQYRAKFPAQSQLPYIELLERARYHFAPYRALMIVREDQDEASFAERFTDDSRIIVTSSTWSTTIKYYERQTDMKAFYANPELVQRLHDTKRINPSEVPYKLVEKTGAYRNEEVIYTTDSYINWCFDKLADFRMPMIEDEEVLYDLDIKQAQFDYATDQLRIRKPRNEDMVEGFLDRMCHRRELNIGADQPVIHDWKGLTKGEKAKVGRAYLLQEDFDFYQKRYDDLMKWISELRTQGQDQLADQVLSWYKQPHIKTCDECGHEYSNDKYRCPICRADNDTCPYDPRDIDPAWEGEDDELPVVDLDENYEYLMRES